jgi:Txe/YoeB family toxin of toxin-antitoxin system
MYSGKRGTVVTYSVVYTKHALKDMQKLKSAHLDEKAKNLIAIIRETPFCPMPPYEKLVGDLQGVPSRRINIKHRLVYQVFEKEKIVKIISMWSHY